MNEESPQGRGPTVAVLGVGAVGLVLVSLLSWQMIELRGNLSQQTTRYETLEDTLAWNLDLSAMEGRRLPDPWTDSLRNDLVGNPSGEETLLVIYTPMVCVTCLRSGLQSLRDHRLLLARRGISPHALVEEHRGSREEALVLRETGLLSFPVTFLPDLEVVESLVVETEANFENSPLYLRLDQDLTVLSAFRADQFRPELLDRWLLAQGQGQGRGE